MPTLWTLYAPLVRGNTHCKKPYDVTGDSESSQCRCWAEYANPPSVCTFGVECSHPAAALRMYTSRPFALCNVYIRQVSAECAHSAARMYTLRCVQRCYVRRLRRAGCRVHGGCSGDAARVCDDRLNSPHARLSSTANCSWKSSRTS